MAILAFDIGGTAVKYGVWVNESLVGQDKFRTPKTWAEMKDKLVAVKKYMERIYELEGVAFSAPGAVNQQGRQIEGMSAVRYLHFFPIYDELEAAFSLPVTFENDANCAALAEVWKGAARENRNVLFVVIGTGIGGAVIIDNKVQQGQHLSAGEFGYMLLGEDKIFSSVGTAVGVARRYAERKGLDPEEVDGKEVFALAKKGDPVAEEEVDTFFRYLTIGLHNLSYAFDPEKIILGGGVSSMEGLVERLEVEYEKLFGGHEFSIFTPVIETCDFKNDANLIGAVYNYLQKSRHTNE